jgi:thiol-disulfide isomerase/thioredoxin
MTRWALPLVVALGTLTGAARLVADDPKKTDPPAAADKKAGAAFLAAKKKFEKDADALIDKIKKATTTADQAKLKAQLRERETKYLAELVGLAEKYPAAEETFHLLTEFVELDGEQAKRAVELMAAHHAARPWAKAALPVLVKSDDPAAAGFLAAVAKDNPDRANRGLAYLFLGMSHKRQAVTGPEGRQKAHLAAAGKALAAAAADYADVKVGPGEKVGKMAEAQLVGLKNLPNLVVGKVAPDIAGEDLDGKPMKLSDYRGKVVLLDFWATWCGPCMRLVPSNRELVEGYKDRPFALVGVNADEDVTDRDAAVKRFRVNWRSFKNAAGDGPQVTDLWNVQGFPTLYLIDHTGVIRKVWQELPDVEALAKEVADLVAAAEKQK